MCCMCHTQGLYLFDNQIGDTGVTALAEACARGALPQCRVLDLRRNEIRDAGITALADACAIGALPQCQVLSLLRNRYRIGDAGITALAQAITPVSEGGSGALPQLKDLHLYEEAPALEAACKARGIAYYGIAYYP